MTSGSPNPFPPRLTSHAALTGNSSFQTSTPPLSVRGSATYVPTLFRSEEHGCGAVNGHVRYVLRVRVEDLHPCTDVHEDLGEVEGFCLFVDGDSLGMHGGLTVVICNGRIERQGW